MLIKYKDAIGLNYLPDPDQESGCKWWIPDLFQAHPEYYPLPDLIMSDFWVWDEVTIDQWTHSLDTYPPKWDDDWKGFDYPAWESLCLNPKVQWTPNLLEKNKTKLNWAELSKSLSLPWSEAELMPFEDHWFWPGFEKNKNIIWSKNMLTKHVDEINWFYFSDHAQILGDPLVFEDYAEKIDWKEIYLNPHIRWDLGLLEKYWEYLDWQTMSKTHNPYFPWSERFIEENKHRISFPNLSGNAHIGIPWSHDFIFKYIEAWDIPALIGNPSIPWTDELIDELYQMANKHSSQIKMNDFPGMSEEKMNEIKKYAIYSDKRRLNAEFCKNTRLKWSVSLIKKYATSFDSYHWEILANNASVPWDHDFFLSFFGQIQQINISLIQRLWDRLFAPYLTDKLVLEILEEITPRLPRLNDLAV